MPGYLGNKVDNRVHHLSAMTPNCRIVEIKKLDKIYFVPDTIDQATTEKFTQCKNCIKN
jgi:hypothetical protein